MDDKKLSNGEEKKSSFSADLPDISGVFEVDESAIPPQAIERDNSVKKEIKTPFLTYQEPKPLTKEELKEQKRRERNAKNAVRKKKMRKITAAVIAALVLIIGLVTGIKIHMVNKAKPTVEVAKAYIGTISKYYTAKEAAILTDAVSADTVTKAVFIENDYDIYGLKKGQPAEVTASDGTVLTGTLTEIKEEKTNSTVISALVSILTGNYSSGNNYTVTVTVNDSGKILAAGTTVGVKVTTDTAANAVLIPTAAIQTDGNQSYVWIYHSVKKTLTRQDIATGIVYGGVTETLKGLKENDAVVTYYSCEPGLLHDGVKIKLQTAEKQ